MLDVVFSVNAAAGCCFSVNATAPRSQSLNAANASENNTAAKKFAKPPRSEICTKKFVPYQYALLDALFSANATAGCYGFSVNATAPRSQSPNAANTSENNTSAKKPLLLQKRR